MLTIPYSALALAFICAASPKAVSAAAPDTDWHPTKMSAMDLAKKADTKLNNLTNVSFTYQYNYAGKLGRYFMRGDGHVKNPQVFVVTFPYIGKEEEEGMQRSTWLSDGKTLTTRRRWPEHEDPVSSEPFPGHRTLPANLLGAWFDFGPQALLSAIGTKNAPLEKLIASASQPGTGLVVGVGEKTIVYLGHRLVYYRLTINRTPAQEKAKGVLFYEVVINAHFLLPTSLNCEVVEGKKTYTVNLNRTDWDLKPGPMDPKLFSKTTVLGNRLTP